jgi:peptidoglycan/xylan/chitin deacetylase (PgdA/CDA1 family)
MPKKLICLILILISNAIFSHRGEIAITIDDLPFVNAKKDGKYSSLSEAKKFNRILQSLKDNKVPATGFIIAGQLKKRHAPLLKAFKESGFHLGNHTFSHNSLRNMRAEDYIADLSRADATLQPYLTYPKYFRYPYLAKGKGETRKKVEAYLAEQNYTIVPISIDSKDFRFNRQLVSIPQPLRKKNLMPLKKRYLAYVWSQTLLAEAMAKKNNKPNKHILLTHANLLNSYFLKDVIAMYQQQGYVFVDVEDVLGGK